MGILFVYILKSSFCLAVFYLFYRLLLSRETFHRFNRIALLGILLLSCLLPFVEVSVRRPVEMYQTMMTWEQWLLLTDLAGTETHAVQVQENVLTWIQGLLLVYLFGILFFMLRNIYSLFGLWVLLKSGRREKVSDYVVTVVKAVLIVHERDISPFSWMRYIVISQKDLHENGREILTHELAHIRNRHSWDLFAADICYVLPVAAIAVTAFARPEVSETVEEISAVKVNDLTAIVETKVAESSGQLLPVQSVPKDSVNRKSKVAVQQMDELVVVGYASKDSVKDREPVFNVVEQMPSFPGGMEALMQYLAKNMRYPVEAQKNKVQGRVVVGFIVSKDGDIKKAHILRGVDPELDAEAIRVIESMPRWMPGMQRGKAVAVSYTLPVMFRLTGDALGLKLVEASGSTAGELDKGVTFSYAEGKQPLCIVNGKEVDWAVMRALNPDRIKSITVLKDKAILEEKYGEKGQNGVLLITLKGYTE